MERYVVIYAIEGLILKNMKMEYDSCYGFKNIGRNYMNSKIDDRKNRNSQAATVFTKSYRGVFVCEKGSFQYIKSHKPIY